MSIKPIIKEAYKDLIWNISRGDINPALAGLRHLLESICDFLYLEYNSKELRSKTLADKITKVGNIREVPKEIFAQIKCIQYLSNVGHHDKSIESRYFLQPALICLSYLLRWIFEEVLKETVPVRYYFYEYLQSENGLILKYFLPNGGYLFEEKVIQNSPLEYDYEEKISFLKRNAFNVFIVIPTSLTSEVIVRPEADYLRVEVTKMITRKLQEAELSLKFSVMVVSDFIYGMYDFIQLQNAILIGNYENQVFSQNVLKGSFQKEFEAVDYLIIEYITANYLAVKTKHRHYIGSEVEKLLKNKILDDYLDKVISFHIPVKE